MFLRRDLRHGADYFANPAVDPVRFASRTLRDKAAQRRLALRWALYLTFRAIRIQ
jgi:hypothetical protein